MTADGGTSGSATSGSGTSGSGTAADGGGIAEVFGRAAAGYERARPSYPQEAVDWLLPPGCRRVVDLAAGTGKLTRLLAAQSLDVVAVEPSEGMRAQFAAVLPGVPVLAGSAEAIPLPDASADAVFVAQAWHWVDPAVATPEVARVLRPGGTLGLLWNLRDEREPWVAELGRLLHADEPQDTSAEAPVVGPPFPPVQRHDVAWTSQLSVDGLADLVASRSYTIRMPPGERDALLSAVRHLATTHPALAGLAGRDTVPLPYLTRCYRTRLPD